MKSLVAHPGVANTQLSSGTVKAGGAADMAKAPKWLAGHRPRDVHLGDLFTQK